MFHSFSESDKRFIRQVRTQEDYERNNGVVDACMACLPPHRYPQSDRGKEKLLSSVPETSPEHDQLRQIERQDRLPSRAINSARLDLININLLALSTLFIITGIPVLVKLEIAVSLSFLSVGVGLVDLGTLRQLSVRLETSSLVGAVLQNYIAFLILVVSERQQDDVSLVDPHLLAKLATDVCQSPGTIEAERLEASISEHLKHLCVFCEAAVSEWDGLT